MYSALQESDLVYATSFTIGYLPGPSRSRLFRAVALLSNLAGQFLRWSFDAFRFAFGNSRAMRMVLAGMLKAGGIAVNGANRVPHAVATFPERVEADGKERAEEPYDADYYPSGEEWL